jgi:hypothetical protein
MFLDFTGFTKDDINVMKDLPDHCDRPSLKARANQRGKFD